MDKVIDGLDVSGCINIDEWEHCNICQVLIKTIPNRHQCLTEGDLRCEFYPDCYYKQLKRLQHYQAEFEHELMNDYTYDGYISPNGFTPIDVIKHIKSELKRLQAENDNLKDDIDKQQLYVDSLEQENEELKQLCDKKDELLNSTTRRGIELEQENERLKSALAIWENAAQKQTALKVVEVDKYRQCLQEIREIVSEPCIVDENCQTCNSGCMQKDISTKINEVIGAEE